MDNVEDYKNEILSIFFSQWRIISICTLLIFTFAILIAYLQPPTYSATGSILIKGKEVIKGPETLEKTNVRSFNLSVEDMFSDAEILTSHNVIENAINFINKNNLIASNDLTVAKIKGNLTTEVLPTSNVIRVAYSSKKSEEVQTVLDIILKQYILYRLSVLSPDTEVFFDNHTNKFKIKLEEKEEEFLKLVEDHNISDPQKQIENNLLLTGSMEQELSFLKNEAIANKRFIEHIAKTLNTSSGLQFYSFIENNVPINNFSTRLQELIIKKADTLQKFHPENDAVVMVEEQIKSISLALNKEVDAYKGSIGNKLEIANAKIDITERKLASLYKDNVNLRKLVLQTEKLTRERDLFRFEYETFAKRREEARVNKSASELGISTYVSILSKAFSSGSPDFPDKKKIIPLGLFIGFITGCSLGFMRDFFDRTFRKPNDITDFTGLPVIFSIRG